MKTTFRQRLLASTLMIGAAAFATPAWAQPTDDDVQENAAQTQPDGTQNSELNQNDVEGETVVVTGSRIQRRDLTSSSPLAVIQDEEFQLSGAINVEQVVNTLPQVVPGSTGADNNPGGGVATLQLRGLGSTRTLILVNGRRYIFFDTNQITDLNTIPQFLIDAVDVVTGGASAVYGSDALAGVVNFRLQTDLQGFQAGANYSITGEGDGPRYGGHIAVGSQMADGRGHVVAFGEYFNRGAVFQGDRDFSRFSAGEACILPGSTDRNTGVGTRVAIPGSVTPSDEECEARSAEFGLAAGGSSTTESARLQNFGGANFNNANFAGTGNIIFQAGGVSRPRTGADLFNYAPANFLQVPQERFLLGGYGEYEITPSVSAFTEVTFINNRVANELAPSPVTGLFNLNVAQTCGFVSAADCARFQQVDANETAANAADNDPNTPGVQTLPDDPGVVNLFVQRRILETGARNQLDERNAYRVLGGVRGSLTDNLGYEAYYSFARTRNSQIQQGNISRSAFQAGLDGTGTPINIFGPGTLTQEQVNAISVPTQNSDISTLQVASASVNGALGNFGLGADDIGFAVGAEYRSVSARFIPDAALGSGDIIGFNAGAPTQGGYNVREVFGELRIPIIADRPGVHRLSLTGAARYSDYSLEAVGGVYTYAGGIEYAPIRDITFRGQYQRAIRAPNVEELFGGQAVGFPGATDPCALPTAATDAAIRAICIANGVPQNRVGDPTLQLNPQIEGLFGGNANLQEERAETFTAGVVLRPSFIPRLNITIDAYDIEIKNVISVLGGTVGNVLNLCFNVIQDQASPFCQAVNRNAGGVISGDQFNVEVLNENIGGFETRGVDLQVDYTQPLAFSLMGGTESRLNFFFLGTYVDQFDITAVAELPDDINECSGRFGQLACGEPIPRYKWTSRLSLIDGPVTVSGRWRHIGRLRDDDDDTDFFVETLGSTDYFDLSMAFDVSDGLRLTMGVNNILNETPVVLGGQQNAANTFPNTFDVLGRDFFISANLRF
jgi:outer membrane receptor protein involved in Fe transport